MKLKELREGAQKSPGKTSGTEQDRMACEITHNLFKRKLYKKKKQHIQFFFEHAVIGIETFHAPRGTLKAAYRNQKKIII